MVSIEAYTQSSLQVWLKGGRKADPGSDFLFMIILVMCIMGLGDELSLVCVLLFG